MTDLLQIGNRLSSQQVPSHSTLTRKTANCQELLTAAAEAIPCRIMLNRHRSKLEAGALLEAIRIGLLYDAAPELIQFLEVRRPLRDIASYVRIKATVTESELGHLLKASRGAIHEWAV
jgi:hypothetical protein